MGPRRSALALALAGGADPRRPPRRRRRPRTGGCSTSSSSPRGAPDLAGHVVPRVHDDPARPAGRTDPRRRRRGRPDLARRPRRPAHPADGGGRGDGARARRARGGGRGGQRRLLRRGRQRCPGRRGDRRRGAAELRACPSAGVPPRRRRPGRTPDTVVGSTAPGARTSPASSSAGRLVAGAATVPLRGSRRLRRAGRTASGCSTRRGATRPASAATCGSDTDAARRVQRRHARGPGGRRAGRRGGTARRGPAARRDARPRRARAGRGVAARPARRHAGVAVDYRFDAVDAPPLRVAVGALPLARAGRPLPGLQATERAPRTAVGLSADGRRLWLVTVDGRQDASIGATLAELGRLLTDLGAPVAASLDGGGSTTMVRRGRDEDLTVVNSPSADPLRAVTDALAVLPADLSRTMLTSTSEAPSIEPGRPGRTISAPTGNTRRHAVQWGVRTGRHVPPGLI